MIVITDYDEFSSCGLRSLKEEVKNCRRFAKLSLGGKYFKTCWQSDLLTPLVLCIKDSIYLIAIDFEILIYDSQKEHELLRIPLDVFFADAILSNGYIIAASETEVFVVSVKNESATLVERIPLPDVFESFHRDEGKVRVICFNGDIIEVKSE